MKRKILAALLLAFVAVVMALSITHFSFNEMMGTVNQLSTPNEKLTKLNDVFEEITMLDQQQRTEAIKNPQKPYKYFLDQSAYLHEMIDSLQMLPWDTTQLIRLSSMKEVLDQRNELFVSYLKVRAELSDNREFSKQLDTLSTLLKESRMADSSVITTQKKIITTYLKADSINDSEKEERSFLRKLFSKKKTKPAESNPVKIQEELKIQIDTLSIAHQGLDLAEIERLINELETDQRTQGRKLQQKELELINANSLFINQLLNILHDVENEELENMRASNEGAALVFHNGISRMNILMISFFLGAAILVYLILVDISKSNYYKTQLEKARDHAEELSKIKQRFLANMSHEIRTPLQSIIGFAELLKHGGNDSREAVSAIHSSSEHLLHIVNEVLDYSRISSGNFTLSKEKFRLIQLIKEVESAMRIQADRKKLSFILDTEKASDYHLLGDPFRLRQILYNLLGNAIKFTHQGFIKLTVKTLEISENIQCIFEIKDTGIGMSSEELKTVFNQFEQANSHITKNYGGTGLGLTIVKSLIEVQDGELEVLSEPGVGSTFRISLGFEKATEAQHHVVQPAETVSKTLNGKVIVIDDDAMIMKLCSLILQKNNIAYTTYHDAEHLIQAQQDPLVSHILLDIRMPKMNGVEVCKALKKIYPEEVKFIALTAHVLPEERESLIHQGFNTVLAKPFHEAELLAALGVSLLEKRPVEDAPDFATVRQMTMGDDSLFYSVIQQFVEESEYDIQKLQGQVETRNKKDIREIVHKFAGRLGQLGIQKLSTKYRELETEIVEGSTYEEISDDLLDVIKETKDLLSNVRITMLEHHSG